MASLITSEDKQINKTKSTLNKYWKKFKGNSNVVGFYKPDHPRLGCLSNFYIHDPQIFTVPHFCWGTTMQASGLSQSVNVKYSEKSIMLCKASLMNDPESYQKIIDSTNPEDTKSLGRKVKPWDQKKWNDFVYLIAKEVIKQKFSKLDKERRHLLGTGNCILAEATSNDCIWGIGLNVNDPDVRNISKWKGKNMLGWALMEVRNELTW